MYKKIYQQISKQRIPNTHSHMHTKSVVHAITVYCKLHILEQRYWFPLRGHELHNEMPITREKKRERIFLSTHSFSKQALIQTSLKLN